MAADLADHLSRLERPGAVRVGDDRLLRIRVRQDEHEGRPATSRASTGARLTSAHARARRAVAPRDRDGARRDRPTLRTART